MMKSVHSCVQDVGKSWAPAFPESVQLSLESQKGPAPDAVAPPCARQPPSPSLHQAHSAPHALISAGWGALAESPQCWIQQLFTSFVLVGVTELIQEAERLQEITAFQEIKSFCVLLPGYSFPWLFLMSLSFPRNIVAVEIYLWKHFAGGALKNEWFSVKSLGKKKN